MSEFKINPEEVPTALRTKILWMQLAACEQLGYNQSTLAVLLS